VGTTIIINIGKARYAWVTLVPMVWLATTTLIAGWLTVRDNFWPMAAGPNPAVQFQGLLNSILTVTMMVLVIIILGAAIRKWLRTLFAVRPPGLAIQEP
jgi:carbon starvation protein